MSLNYENLDEITRKHMIQELNLDTSNVTVYFSKRFNPKGRDLWVSLLREAITNHNDKWLENQLQSTGCFLEYETYTRNGVTRDRRVPADAATICAEGEFNRFYSRGLCSRGILEKIPFVQVYRGKQVTSPRPESQSKLGELIPVERLLEDLRTSQGVEPALGIPPGPNSGLTIRFPK